MSPSHSGNKWTLWLFFVMHVLPLHDAQQVMDATPAAELKRLRTDLLKNYDKTVRPMKNKTIPTDVQIYFNIRRIVEMDEKYQTLTVRGILMVYWYDEHLTWDIEKYSGLTNVKFRPTELWVPDIHSIYNTKMTEMFSEKGAPASVYNQGSVTWYTQAEFSVPCRANYRHYPFDRHACSIYFGAWTYNGDDITLQTYNMQKQTFKDDVEWRLVKVSHRNEVLQPNPQYKYHMVVVNMIMERVSRVYRYIYVLPTLSALLSSLFGFWLLPKDTSRYLIGLSNILLTTLLLQYLASTVPAGREMPLLAQYSATCLCMSGAFILVTVINHLLGERSGPVPKLVLRLTHRLPLDRMLCLFACNGSAPYPTIDAPPGQPGENKKDWMRVSLLLDRLFFCAFVCVYVVLVAVLAAI